MCRVVFEKCHEDDHFKKGEKSKHPCHPPNFTSKYNSVLTLAAMSGLVFI